MLTPGEIEALSMTFDSQMRALENRVMEDIVRRIRLNGEVTSAADWQINRLIQMGLARRDIEKAVENELSLSDEDVRLLFEKAACSGYVRDADIYKSKGIERLPFEENTVLQQTIEGIAYQTSAEMKNITRSLGFAVRNADGNLNFLPAADYCQKTLDSAVYGIAQGVFDYNFTIKRVAKELTDSGLRTIDYATGWSNRVDVAARRAVMTGLNQLIGKMNDMNAGELGTDTFEVTWHGGARPAHQVWQGRWYTKGELVSICGLGSVTGLLGANCYHSYFPVIPGIDEPTYSEQQLEEMNRRENTPREYGGKQYTAYDALQRQRRLETEMRAQRQKIHLLETGGTDEDDIISARAKYRGTSQEYSRFSKAMGIPQQRQRVTSDGLGNIGVGKWKKTAKKINLDNITELSDDKIQSIIKSGRVNLKIHEGKQGKHIRGHNNYMEGKSYLTISIEKAQDLVNRYAGSGKMLRTRKGIWNKKETIYTDEFIGVDIDDKTGIMYSARGFNVHYSEKGVHIVPKR